MHIICHYNEIAIKGKNRDFFENKLIENIRFAFKNNFPETSLTIQKLHGRIVLQIESEQKIKEKNIEKVLSEIFGLHNFAFALTCEKDLLTIQKICWEIIQKKRFKNFRITTQRGDKSFPLTSVEINQRVGEFIFKKTQKPVNLKKPTLNCFIEITTREVFIYFKKIRGIGGMPIGSSSRALSLLSGGIDSPVAAFFGMKRGVPVDFVHFHSFPHTSRASIEKVEQLAKIVSRFQKEFRVFLIPFAEIQKEIMMKTQAKFRVILYRRLMLRIAEKIATQEKYLAIYTGESVGQVASQTLENIFAVEECVKIPVLRPLIGFDKEEIITKAKAIGTYETSILPHEDCCTRFIPKNPETRAKLEEVLAEEEKLNTKKMIDEAIKSMKIKNSSD